MKSAVLAIRIIGDATSAVAAMDKAKAASMTFKEGLNKASVAAGASLAAIGAGAKVCVDAAADLQQSVGGVETVFESSAGKMKQWSDNAAQAVGLSKNEYNEFATLVGSQLQNFGMSVDESADKTNELITLGADLSSMFGGTTADAVDALSAALKGEMDPIEKYGISLNDATLKAQAASMGLGDLYKSGDRNAKMQATLAAITAQSGKATGNFARESDTLQGQQQRMAAAFENTKATLGEALLPILTQVAAKLAEFATWVQQNTSWLVPLIGVIAAVAAVIITLNAAMTAYSAVATIVAIAQGSVNLAFSAGHCRDSGGCRGNRAAGDELGQREGRWSGGGAVDSGQVERLHGVACRYRCQPEAVGHRHLERDRSGVPAGGRLSGRLFQAAAEHVHVEFRRHETGRSADVQRTARPRPKTPSTVLSASSPD